MKQRLIRAMLWKLEFGHYTLSPSLMATAAISDGTISWKLINDGAINDGPISDGARERGPYEFGFGWQGCGEEQAPLYFVYCTTVWRVFIMERLALMIYWFFYALGLCIDTSIFLGPLINAFKFKFTGAIKSAGFFRVWKVVSASCARGCARARCPLVGVVWSQSSTGYQRRESEAKNPLSLTAVIICLAKINYHKIIERQKSGRPMQVNGAFYSIEKSRVICRYSRL